MSNPFAEAEVVPPKRGRKTVKPEPIIVPVAPRGDPTIDDFRSWQRKYRNDPVNAVRDTWGVEPDTWQIEFLEAIFVHEKRRIAVPSGHGVGKTAGDAWAAILFVLTRFPCKVPITAPSSATLEDGLMAEIKHWINLLPPGLKALLEVKSDRIELKESPEDAFISTRTARAEKPDALQGIHSDYVLMICDEASGIPEGVFEAAQGSLAGPARTMVLTGNPVYATGYFARAITEGKGTTWWVREVSCLESKRVPREYIDEIAHLYGEESNTYRVRVEGKPPVSDDDTIIPVDLITDSLDRDVMLVPSAPNIWGLDVARLGANQSALAKRKGNHLLEPVTRYNGRDLMQLCGTIAAEYQGTPELKRPVEICVDAIGMGAGVVDRGRELGLPMVGINVSEHKAVDPMYWNVKAEIWWKALGWFRGRDVWMPRDGELVKALSCVRVKHHSTGKLMVEGKDEMQRRMKSFMPRMDAADAFVLTFGSYATAALYGRAKGTRNAPLKRGFTIV